MRRMLVVLVWVVATVGVTYVANAAVELVDLQVFPQGARIEVLTRANPTPTTLQPMRATTAPPVVTTTAAAAATTVAAPTTTVAAPVVTTTTVVAATTIAPTTTVAVTPTTTAVRAPATTTTAPVATTTTTRPPTTTTRPPTTTTRPPALAMADSVLDGGRTGIAYRTRLVMDGSAPFVWKVESGSLPVGLDLTGDGYLEGTPTNSGHYVFTASAADRSGLTGAAEYSIVVKEFRVISARGGSVTVIVQGNSVAFFSALQAEGFDKAVLVRSGPIVVEVQFLPSGGDETSWVRCEAADVVVCSHG